MTAHDKKSMMGQSERLVCDEWQRMATRFGEALREIRDYDAFQGGPIAPRENPTTTAMRRIAEEALRDA
jgi:hypothetical protein